MKFWSADKALGRITDEEVDLDNLHILFDTDEEYQKFCQTCAKFVLNERQAIINKYKLTDAQFNDAFPPNRLSIGIALHLDEYGNFKRTILKQAEEKFRFKKIK